MQCRRVPSKLQLFVLSFSMLSKPPIHKLDNVAHVAPLVCSISSTKQSMFSGRESASTSKNTTSSHMARRW